MDAIVIQVTQNVIMILMVIVVIFIVMSIIDKIITFGIHVFSHIRTDVFKVDWQKFILKIKKVRK